jgi:hypothetical protein
MVFLFVFKNSNIAPVVHLNYRTYQILTYGFYQAGVYNRERGLANLQLGDNLAILQDDLSQDEEPSNFQVIRGIIHWYRLIELNNLQGDLSQYGKETRSSAIFRSFWGS